MMTERYMMLGFARALRMHERETIRAFVNGRVFRAERLIIAPDRDAFFVIHGVRADDVEQMVQGARIPAMAFRNDGQLALNAAKVEYSLDVERVPDMRRVPWWLRILRALRLKSVPVEPETRSFIAGLVGTGLVDMPDGPPPPPHSPVKAALKRLQSLEDYLNEKEKLDERCEEYIDDIRDELLDIENGDES